MGYRPKWRIAWDQVLRLRDHGVTFDWLVFDEGYGSKVPFLTVLSVIGQRFVAEVPVNFAVSRRAGPSRRADAVLTATAAKRGRRYRVKRVTANDQVWRATRTAVRVGGRRMTLVVAINEATAEVKDFVTNATGVSLKRLLSVAFRRATIEHAFRVAKSEAGLMHYEGRQYVGLVRHLIVTLVVLGFVSGETDRLRGKKSAGDVGASVPSVEREVCGGVPSSSGGSREPAHGRGDPVSSAAERTGHEVPQEAAA